MTTTYINTERPVLMKYLIWGCIVCSIVCLSLLIIMPDTLWKGVDMLTRVGIFWFPYTAWYLKHHKFQTITIDEENGLLINSHHKDNPLKISDISIVRYKRTLGGRYRCLYIHDDSVRFFDILAPIYTAVRIRHHLMKLNPDIKS